MFPRGLVREYAPLMSVGFRMADAILILCAGLLSYVIKFGYQPLPVQYDLAYLISTLLVLIVFSVLGIYLSWRSMVGWRHHVRMISIAWASVIAILIFTAFATKTSTMYSRQWFLMWAVFGWVFLVFFRLLLYRFLGSLRAKGWNHKRVLIVGAGELGQTLAFNIQSSTWMGFDIIGFVDDKGSLRENQVNGVPVLGSIDDLAALVSDNEVDEVLLTLPMRAWERIEHVQHLLRHSTATVRFIPDIYGQRLINHSVTEFAGLPALNLTESPMMGINVVLKLAEDKILALIILLLISPLFVAIAIGVKLSSAGPVFYKQERVSWNGRRFMMYKFRSMPVDVESQSGPKWASSGESRATRFGFLLRKTSLDELPQFINVLKGEMSIVGPRPERPFFVEKFKDEIPYYMKKHLVKAGITGWAQVNGWRGDTDLNKRIEYDLYYVENWSLWLDLKIIVLTVYSGFVHKNAY